MIRRAFGSGLSNIGLVLRPSPVLGSTRIMVPSRLTGSVISDSIVRTSWLRSAPPSAFGGVGLVPVCGSPHGFTGLPSWPQSAKLNEAPSPAVA